MSVISEVGYYARCGTWGLLWVNRGTDANRLNDFLTFMFIAILNSGKQIFGMRKPSKFHVPGWNELAKVLNVQWPEVLNVP